MWCTNSLGVLAIFAAAPGQSFVPVLNKLRHDGKLNVVTGSTNSAEKAQIKSSDFQAVDPL